MQSDALWYALKLYDGMHELLNGFCSLKVHCRHVLQSIPLFMLKNEIMIFSLVFYILGTWSHLRYIRGSVLAHFFIWLVIPTCISRLITLRYLGHFMYLWEFPASRINVLMIVGKALAARPKGREFKPFLDHCCFKPKMVKQIRKTLGTKKWEFWFF